MTLSYRIIKVIIIAFIITDNLLGFNDNFPIINYSTKEYGRTHESTNLSIIQDHRGLMYIANANGVLEYDGTKWNFIQVRNGIWVLSMDIDENGLIYLGSQNEFGYIYPDKLGALIYKSLSDTILNLNDIDNNFWRTHCTSQGIFFQSEHNIFRFNNNKFYKYTPTTTFHLSFKVNDTIYVRERGVGLKIFDGNNFSKVQGSEIFSDIGVFSILPGKNNNELIIITQEEGLWKYFKDDDKFERIKIDNYNFITSSKIYGGILLQNGNYALNSLMQGLLIFNGQSQIINVFDKNKGLRDNYINAVTQDKQGNLWLALNNGISIIEYNSPLQFFTEDNGIIGNIYAINKLNNVLYIGTSNGLFSANLNEEENLVFSKIEGFNTHIWNLTKIQNTLIIGTNEGLYEIKNNEILKIDNINSYEVFYDSIINILFVSGYNGLNLYSRKNNWKFIKSIPEISNDVLRIQKQVNSSVYWLGTQINRLFRLEIINDLNYSIHHYDEASGLPVSWIIPEIVNENIVFCTREGLFSINKDSSELLDSLHENITFSSFEIYGKQIQRPIYLINDHNELTWFYIDGELQYYNKSLKNFEYQPFLKVEMGKINTIFQDKDNIWFGADDGLILYNSKVVKDYNQEYHCLIRKVLCNNDFLLFAGTFYSQNSNNKYQITLNQNDKLIKRLEYKFNNISFEFSAPFFIHENKTKYKYKLIGFQDEWSDWQNTNFKEYTNLNEGEYTFVVKAKNIYENQSQPAVYSFFILPPWYRTKFAYFIFSILLILTILAIIKLSIIRLERQKRKLQEIVNQRTIEIRMQKEEIIIQKNFIEQKNKDITDSITYAQRIQNALLVNKEKIKSALPDSFILYKPRDIVSGDFYWFGEVDNKIIISAIDCTGHGVPGAFMSMLGDSYLNQIIYTHCITSPDLILSELNKNIKRALRQEETNNQDGMDMAICVIDKKNKKLEFAGAKNPLVYIKNDEYNTIKGDKKPIGGMMVEDRSYTKHILNINKQIFYIFSDGYQDQFGGESNTKFMTKRFYNLLVDVHDKPFDEQQEILDRIIEKWKGNNAQIDDILVIGFKI